jgi:hypothetical protein
VVHLYGSPYARGLQHGAQLSSKIHSFYTTLLTASLFPYLGREQSDLETLLPIYRDPRYANGAFAYQLMLDSARNVEHSLSDDVRNELRGISDGSGMSYDDVLVLNTFVDTLLAVRAIALAIRLSRAPQLTQLGVEGAAPQPYQAVPWASLTEVPASPVFHVTLADPDGIDRASVRAELDGTLLGDDAVSFTDLDAGVLDVRIAAGDLGPPGAHTLVMSASDTVRTDIPPPTHENVMRDEEILFTTQGTGLDAHDVLRPRLDDGRTRPPPVAFALRSTPLLAQHFALLDANTAHEHTVVLVQHPDDGTPAFATVGWAGVIYGFSGLSSAGLGAVCNPSDTLNNSVVANVLAHVDDLSKARLVASGTPIGFALRKVLSTATDAASAVATVEALSHVYGWSCVFADAAGGVSHVEVDSGAFSAPAVHADETATQDALIASSAYRLLLDDAPTLSVAGERVVPQRDWSGFFFRSQRVAAAVQRSLKPSMSVEEVEMLLGDDQLVDRSDSMNAVVIEPAAHRLSAAMGQVPATAGPFEAVEVTP